VSRYIRREHLFFFKLVFLPLRFAAVLEKFYKGYFLFSFIPANDVLPGVNSEMYSILCMCSMDERLHGNMATNFEEKYTVCSTHFCVNGLWLEEIM
jgi:hypothetical protein